MSPPVLRFPAAADRTRDPPASAGPVQRAGQSPGPLCPTDPAGRTGRARFPLRGERLQTRIGGQRTRRGRLRLRARWRAHGPGRPGRPGSESCSPQSGPARGAAAAPRYARQAAPPLLPLWRRIFYRRCSTRMRRGARPAGGGGAPFFRLTGPDSDAERPPSLRARTSPRLRRLKAPAAAAVAPGPGRGRGGGGVGQAEPGRPAGWRGPPAFELTFSRCCSKMAAAAAAPPPPAPAAPAAATTITTILLLLWSLLLQPVLLPPLLLLILFFRLAADATLWKQQAIQVLQIWVQNSGGGC